MPALTLSQITSPEYVKNRNIQKVGGLKISILEQPNLYNIKRAESILTSQNIIRVPQSPVDPLTIQSLAEYVLDGLGCTYSGEPADFSLIGTQTDQETIENPAIMDTVEWKVVRNEPIRAVDKFINIAEDPFYKLDDDLSHELQNQLDEEAKKSTPDGTFIVSDLMLYNTNAVKDKLKQFKF